MKQFVKYDEIYDNEHLSEIGQSGTLKFAFAELKGNEVIAQHRFVKCRDFLGDAVISTQGKFTAPRIYGFIYNGEAKPVDTEVTRLVLRMNSVEELEAFDHNIIPLNKFFRSMKLKATRVETLKVPDNDNNTEFVYLMVEGDPLWVTHPTLLSFYTLMLRIATTIKCDGYWDDHLKNPNFEYNDIEYLTSFNETFKDPKDFIRYSWMLDVNEIVDLLKDRPEKMETVHEHGGIATFSQLVKCAEHEDFEEMPGYSSYLEEEDEYYNYLETQPNSSAVRAYAEALFYPKRDHNYTVAA